MASKRKPWGSGVLELPKDKIKRLEKLVESANEALNRLVKEKLDLEIENISLRQEKEELLESLESTKIDRDKVDQERIDLDNKVTTLKRDLEIKEHLVKKLREQVEAKDQNIVNLLEETKQIPELLEKCNYWEKRYREEREIATFYYKLPIWARETGTKLTDNLIQFDLSTLTRYLEDVREIERKIRTLFESKIHEIRARVS